MDQSETGELLSLFDRLSPPDRSLVLESLRGRVVAGDADRGDAAQLLESRPSAAATPIDRPNAEIEGLMDGHWPPGAIPIDEVRRRHDGEWVLLDRVVTIQGTNVLGGRVLWHGPRRADLYEFALANRPGRGAVLYFGPGYQGDVAVNL